MGKLTSPGSSKNLGNHADPIIPSELTFRGGENLVSQKFLIDQFWSPIQIPPPIPVRPLLHSRLQN
jgi:hypothetical protein